MTSGERWKNFIGEFGEDAPFYCRFERGGTTFYVQNFAEGWLEFHCMACALPGGLVIGVALAISNNHRGNTSMVTTV
mgnify:CR=1 FL=1